MDSEYMIFGISFNWERRKGLDVFLRLADELSEIYSKVNVVINSAREDNFPAVNIESFVCRTPFISFIADGSAEKIDNYSDVGIEQVVA